MSISSCGVLFDLSSLELYLVVRAYGIVSAGVWCVLTIWAGSLFIRSTLGCAWVFTLVVLVCFSVRSSLWGAPGLFRRAWNRVESCLRDSNFVSTIFANGAWGFSCSSDSVKSTSAIADRFTEDMNGILVWWGKKSTVSQPFLILFFSHIFGDTCSSP